MATRYIYGTTLNDSYTFGSINWDDPDNFWIYTYAGNDFVQMFADGSVHVDLGADDDTMRAWGSGTYAIHGGEGNDTINHYENYFDDGVAKMYGGDGNDWIESRVSGSDLLDGGAGDDYLALASGNKAIGGSGDDTYDLYNIFDPYDSQDDVTIVEQANSGYDTIEANFAEFRFMANIEAYVSKASSDVKIWGNDSNNDVFLGQGNDYVKLNGGDDSVYSGSGNDVIYADAGNDSVYSGFDDDIIYAGDGNDKVDSGSGDDVVYGDAGNDTVKGGVDDDLIYGGIGDDILFGDNAKWGLQGQGDGQDTLYGGDGNDQLFGGYGSDLLDGGAGDDYLFADGRSFEFGTLKDNKMIGGTGNDTYMTAGFDIITELANQGNDTIDFIGKTYTLGANIENLAHAIHPYGLEGMSYYGDTVITGNALANVITGNKWANTVYGEAGADTLRGMEGNDSLWGGLNDDQLEGGEGDDLLYGEAGNDRAYGGLGNDSVYGGAGNDELSGHSGDDFLSGDAGNDTIYGGNDNDLITGGQGYDSLYGESGNDVLRGGQLNDFLFGNDGADKLWGEDGSDIMWGGTGTDAFVYSSVKHSQIGLGIDQIKDFERGMDTIDLSAIDANALMRGNQAFTWLGVDVRSLPNIAAGNLWGTSVRATETTDAYIKVFGDTNGDGFADMQIDVFGALTLSASDFLL